MGKNHRHQKQLKSEKAKVKLKTKGSKQLPKGLNITDASFKVKKIVIREQLKKQDESQILSHRKLNVKDLLTRLQHYNSSVRQAAIRDLKEILSEHSVEVLNIQLNVLIKGIAALALDKEKAIRRESLKALNLILSPISKEQLSPFCNILISYLTCAMTHINPNIMEDSLLFLDILIQHCYSFLANESHKILLYFLDMISKLHSQSKPGRQLTTNLNSKNTNIKWRVKVLRSLHLFLIAIVQNKRNTISSISQFSSKVYKVTEKNDYFPIYSPISLKTDFLLIKNSYSKDKINKSINLETLQNYIESLMPLMFDSWIEVCPRKSSPDAQLSISDEAASLLKCVTSIIQSVIELLELLENERETLLFSIWFKNKYQKLFIENFLLEFPYVQEKNKPNSRKNLLDTTSNECLEQNFNLSYIYIWFTTICSTTKANNFNKEISSKILLFVIDNLDNWSTSCPLTHLTKVLRILLIKTNTIWYRNELPLSSILKSAIDTYLHKKDESLEIHLFKILQEIVMNHNLNHLHKEDSFKKFIQTLPSLLLKNHINDCTIQMLNRVVLQYQQWVQEELIQNYDSIIENAKKIQIKGSENEQNSRLMICNLFYFMDEQVYY